MSERDRLAADLHDRNDHLGPVCDGCNAMADHLIALGWRKVECWCPVESPEQPGGGVNPHCPQHGRSSEAIVYAKPKPPHADGERHRYRIVCLDCGEEGTVRLSIDPEAYREDTDA